jgi:excisionase family DNA binding protein
MDEQVFFNVPLIKLEPIFKRWMREALPELQPHSEPHPTGYITRAQVCDRLHITLPTVHSWMKQGKLRAYHIGGRTLFKESEVMAAIQPVNYSVK